MGLVSRFVKPANTAVRTGLTPMVLTLISKKNFLLLFILIYFKPLEGLSCFQSTQLAKLSYSCNSNGPAYSFIISVRVNIPEKYVNDIHVCVVLSNFRVKFNPGMLLKSESNNICCDVVFTTALSLFLFHAPPPRVLPLSHSLLI